MSKVNFIPSVMIPRKLIRPNAWNPNTMNADTFHEVVSNIEELGFVQDVVIAPLPDEEALESGYQFRIVDGEHRFDALSLFDEIEEIPCKIVDIPEDNQKFQTVKLNKLRGKMDQKRFNSLVKDLMQRYTFEEVAQHMAFTDPSELEALIGNARDTLPTNEMKTEFDKARGEIKTVDDLTMVLNRLFTQFGDTLPFNFMVLDFGGKEHLWVRLDPGEFRRIQSKARDCIAHGVTFDSVLARVLTILPVDKFIKSHRDFLKEPSDDDVSKGKIFQID